MGLYPYQQQVNAIIQSGKPVILQAPTGMGKTRAALSPFIESFFDRGAEKFPRKCIYSVPMRILANQFVAEYKELAGSYERRFERRMKIAIQTGEQPDDPKLQSNLIFATIDQTLSSALGVPYSLSARQANLNAGAVFSSYLVFDEFHLFPVNRTGNSVRGALVTTLQLLTRLKQVTPFVLMTATFSSTMLGELAQRLDAQVVTVGLEEYRQIAAGDKGRPRQRRYWSHDETLGAEAVLMEHEERTIAICNQVERAQNLYDDLASACAGTDTQVWLMHSRFTPEDRRAKEEALRREFGPKPELRRARSVILVATQVIEVGVDITSQRLHSEIAPANAVFQRAGRCARYPGEEGEVHLYRVPERERRDGSAVPDYLPYDDELCAQSAASFAGRSGQVLDFTGEQEVVDEVHTEMDKLLLAQMDRHAAKIWLDIYAALEGGDTSHRQELIRSIDNITVLSAAQPEQLGNPFRSRGFGLHVGTVKKMYNQLEAHALGGELPEGGWTMCYPQVSEPDPEDPFRRPTVQWQPVTSVTLLDSLQVVAIRNDFVAYDSECGFRVVQPAEANGWQSPPGEWSVGNRFKDSAYQLETYAEHIRRMLAIYDRRYAGDVAYAERRLGCSIQEAVRLAIAAHDLGKLDGRWQRWVRLYQQGIGQPVQSDEQMIVHTEFDRRNPLHVAAGKRADQGGPRPHHAAESAIAAMPVLLQMLPDMALRRAVFGAIARHHSPNVDSVAPFDLAPAAVTAWGAALAAAGFTSVEPALKQAWSQTSQLDSALPEAQDFEQLLLYLYVVRFLRLCDGESQER